MRLPVLAQSALLSLVVVSAMGCNTALKNARKNLEGGNYDAAAEQFEALVASKPNDPELLQALQEARQGAIGKRLIEARMFRLGEDLNSSLERLREVIEMERRWGVSPKGQAVFTQNEEITLAWPAFQKRIRSTLGEGKPLKSEWMLRRFTPVFEGGQNSKGLGGLRSETQAVGLTDCKSRVKTAFSSLLYHASFVRRYCGVWGGDVSALGAASSIFEETYGSQSLTINAEGLSSSEQALWRSIQEKTFRDSPWYQAGSSRNYGVNLLGSFEFRQTSRPIRQVHSYSVNETVTETAPDQKTTIQKQKTVPKEYVYWATEHVRDANFRLQSTPTGDVGNWVALAQGTDHQAEIEHRENQPSMGLYPKSISMRDRGTIFENAMLEYERKIRTEYVQSWVREYCQQGAPVRLEPSVQGLGAVQEERVFRCARVLGSRSSPENAPTFAQDYMEQNFGLGIRESLSLLGN